VLVVRAGTWSSTEGVLQRYDRANPRDSWASVGAPVRVALGRAGLAWGRGLHPGQGGVQKKEGDGKAPAGVFRLPSTFGYAPDAPGNLPYTAAESPDIQCVDDPGSGKYNLIVNRADVPFPDWKSFEVMRRSDEQYRLGVVVEHNPKPAQPGGGSCIFLHIWKAPGEPTQGCTSMDASTTGTLVRWLDWMSEPVLVQLPEAEYKRLRQAWALP
jgi:L,D-peptidoglycan transpeptidase YkuD (ErfK/YbiS/YcfS/YnhG family)